MHLLLALIYVLQPIHGMVAAPNLPAGCAMDGKNVQCDSKKRPVTAGFEINVEFMKDGKVVCAWRNNGLYAAKPRPCLYEHTNGWNKSTWILAPPA